MVTLDFLATTKFFYNRMIRVSWLEKKLFFNKPLLRASWQDERSRGQLLFLNICIHFLNNNPPKNVINTGMRYSEINEVMNFQNKLKGNKYTKK